MADELNVRIFKALRAKVEADPDAAGLFTGRIFDYVFLGVKADISPALTLVEDEFYIASRTRGGSGNSAEAVTFWGSLMYQIAETTGSSPRVVSAQLHNGLYKLQRILRRYTRNTDPYWQNLRMDAERRAIYGRQEGQYQIGVVGFIVDTEETAPD